MNGWSGVMVVVHGGWARIIRARGWLVGQTVRFPPPFIVLPFSIAKTHTHNPPPPPPFPTFLGRCRKRSWTCLTP
jgi:hypothetical protein